MTTDKETDWVLAARMLSCTKYSMWTSGILHSISYFIHFVIGMIYKTSLQAKVLITPRLPVSPAAKTKAWLGYTFPTAQGFFVGNLFLWFGNSNQIWYTFLKWYSDMFSASPTSGVNWVNDEPSGHPLLPCDRFYSSVILKCSELWSEKYDESKWCSNNLFFMSSSK